MKTHPNIVLLLAMLPVLAWSGWRPYDRMTWWLEVSPVFIGFIALFIAQIKGWRLSNVAIVLIAAGQVILATGAQERPFPIPGWTLPGVMTAASTRPAAESNRRPPLGFACFSLWQLKQ